METIAAGTLEYGYNTYIKKKYIYIKNTQLNWGGGGGGCGDVTLKSLFTSLFHPLPIPSRLT